MKAQIDSLCCSIERNVELMDRDVKKLINVIRNITEEKCSLGIRGNVFLSRFSRISPQMNEVIQAFKKIST